MIGNFRKIYSGWHITYRFFKLKFRFRYKPKHTDTVNLVFDKKAGIGNRIFGIVNSLNYFTPNELNIYWDTENWVNCKLDDIFDIKTKTQINEYNSLDFINEENKKSITIIGAPQDIRTKDGRKISLKYNQIKKDDIEYFNTFFKNIKPSKEVIKRLENFNREFDYVVQIRNNNDWQNFGRNEELDLFFSEIKKVPENSKIFLSAMNKNVSDIVKNEFKGRIFELENKDYSSMTDATADLYIMSRAKNAIYSFGSTFGELAFWLGGAKQRVTVVGSYDNWK